MNIAENAIYQKPLLKTAPDEAGVGAGGEAVMTTVRWEELLST